jgi:hypothetical protein
LDDNDVPELREEVTLARVAAVTAGAQGEKMAQENAILLASAHAEAGKVAWKVSFLKGELVVAC